MVTLWIIYSIVRKEHTWLIPVWMNLQRVWSEWNHTFKLLVHNPIIHWYYYWVGFGFYTPRVFLFSINIYWSSFALTHVLWVLNFITSTLNVVYKLMDAKLRRWDHLQITEEFLYVYIIDNHTVMNIKSSSTASGVNLLSPNYTPYKVIMPWQQWVGAIRSMST